MFSEVDIVAWCIMFLIVHFPGRGAVFSIAAITSVGFLGCCWIDDIAVMWFDDIFHIWHAAVTHFDGIPVAHLWIILCCIEYGTIQKAMKYRMIKFEK